jgi:predicted transcriptional regulator
MRTAIEQYLDREERYEREKQEDLERWTRYQATGHAVSHEDASQWLTDLTNGKAPKCPG